MPVTPSALFDEVPGESMVIPPVTDARKFLPELTAEPAAELSVPRGLASKPSAKKAKAAYKSPPPDMDDMTQAKAEEAILDVLIDTGLHQIAAGLHDRRLNKIPLLSPSDREKVAETQKQAAAKAGVQGADIWAIEKRRKLEPEKEVKDEQAVDYAAHFSSENRASREGSQEKQTFYNQVGGSSSSDGPAPAKAKAIAKAKDLKVEKERYGVTPSDHAQRMAEKFPYFPREAYITLPCREGDRPWISTAACKILRHSNSSREAKNWYALMRVHEHMRMLWPEFLEDWLREIQRSHRNKSPLAPHLRFPDLQIDSPTRHGKAIRSLIQNSGDKLRFRLRYSDAVRRQLNACETLSKAWWAIVDANAPLEIKCIQGGGGQHDLAPEDTFEVPEDHDLVFHYSYLRHARPILMGAGICAGGDRGISGRGNVYATAADPTLFLESYKPEEKAFTQCRNEPYWPRAD